MTETEVQRALPEGQQKVDSDKKKDEDQLLANIQEADKIREQLEEVSYRTNDDGTIEGIVKQISMTKKNGTIAVDIDVPAETDPHREHFDKPKSWTRDWRFVRFVEAYGKRASSITSMIEEGVKVKIRMEDDEYELVIPSKAREIAREKFRGMKEESHPIWGSLLLIGALAGFSVVFSVLPSSNPEIVNILGSAVVGGILGFIAMGLLQITIGTIFFGWEM